MAHLVDRRSFDYRRCQCGKMACGEEGSCALSCTLKSTPSHLCTVQQVFPGERHGICVRANGFVKEGLQYVAIQVFGCSVRSGLPFNGYQDKGRHAVSVCHGQGWSVALHQTEQPLLKDTIVVPQTYMAASRAGWERSEAVNGARRPSFCLGCKLLVKREWRCRCAITTRD